MYKFTYINSCHSLGNTKHIVRWWRAWQWIEVDSSCCGLWWHRIYFFGKRIAKRIKRRKALTFVVRNLRKVSFLQEYKNREHLERIACVSTGPYKSKDYRKQKFVSNQTKSIFIEFKWKMVNNRRWSNNGLYNWIWIFACVSQVYSYVGDIADKTKQKSQYAIKRKR